MSEPLYSVWLQQCLGYASQATKPAIEYFKTARNIYEASYDERLRSGVFTSAQLRKMSEKKLETAEKIIEKCKAYRYSILSIEYQTYPQKLYEISNPPAVIYVSGTMPDVDNILTIGVVGTRTATTEGIRNSFTFGRNLARCGAVVVSGGALGIDCASHRGVLQNDGITICVLGCGINYDYLPANAPMRRLIAKKGAVISEYPPDTPPANYNFPSRNRIISGLSNGVLVIEAGDRSGSLITAHLALEQNREVFSVPGSLVNIYSRGTNSLIKQGAIPVTSYRDIVAEYAQRYELIVDHDEALATEEEVREVPFLTDKLHKAPKPKSSSRVSFNKEKIISKEKPKKQIKCPNGVSAEAEAVFSCLNDEPLHIDQISDLSGLRPQQVMSALTELEIFGAAKNVSGGRYTRS